MSNTMEMRDQTKWWSTALFVPTLEMVYTFFFLLGWPYKCSQKALEMRHASVHLQLYTMSVSVHGTQMTTWCSRSSHINFPVKSKESEYGSNVLLWHDSSSAVISTKWHARTKAKNSRLAGLASAERPSRALPYHFLWLANRTSVLVSKLDGDLPILECITTILSV